MIKNKILFYFIIITYLGIGSYLSVTNGITSDEFFEQLNWEKNLSGIKNFLANGNYDDFLKYQDKYHGIAFHYISQPIQFLTYKFVSTLNEVSTSGAYLMSKHFVVFLLFFISGFSFYYLCLKLTNNKFFSFISSSIYLLYPYLFGHAMFNMKDIPFLSLWLISTYFYLTLVEDLFFEKELKYNQIFLVSFFTAFLISIRILGLAILLQYLISLIILFNIKKINLIDFIKENYKKVLSFVLFIFLLIYIMNPVLWHNPLEIINSYKWMSNYFNNICTLTLGDCMSSLSLPSSYYFIWLFFKLPILILLGIVIFPLIEGKIFSQKIVTIYYGTILFSLLSLLFIFILIKINIYDELRHVIFIFPLIFLLSLTNIYYLNKKFFFVTGSLLIIFFIFENKSLNPYQYTWLNSFAKFTNIQKNFEIDYWGVSNKNLQKKIIDYAAKNNISKNTCIYGDNYTKEFLITKDFTCFKRYQQLGEKRADPVFAYKNLRDAKRSKPIDCKLIWDETYKYTFYKKEISVGTLWWCD